MYHLPQLGLRLRLQEDKPHLTVLDFIAPPHRHFRYVDRFQDLTGYTHRNLDVLPNHCVELGNR